MPATIEIPLEDLIPKKMAPGTLLLFENDENESDMDPDRYIPFAGVFSCPRCQTTGYMTYEQIAGLSHKICSSDKCSAEYLLKDGPDGKEFEFRNFM